MINVSLEQAGNQSNLLTFSHEDLIVAACMPVLFVVIGLVLNFFIVGRLTRKLKKQQNPRAALLGESIRKSTRFLIVPLSLLLGLQTAQSWLKPIGSIFEFTAGALKIGLIAKCVVFVARLAEILMTKLPLNPTDHAHPVVTSILINLVRAVIVSLGGALGAQCHWSRNYADANCPWSRRFGSCTSFAGCL